MKLRRQQSNCFHQCGSNVASTEAKSDPGRHMVVSANVLKVLQDIGFADYVYAGSSTLLCDATTDEDIVTQDVDEEPTVKEEMTGKTRKRLPGQAQCRL